MAERLDTALTRIEAGLAARAAAVAQGEEKHAVLKAAAADAVAALDAIVGDA